MAICVAPTLVASGACFAKVSPTMAQLTKLALLCQIFQTLDPMATCNVDTLLASAADSQFCTVTDNPYELVELQLLCEIEDLIALGAGPLSDYIAYSGPPLVNPPAIQHIVVDVDGRQWQYFNGAWA